MKTFGLIYADIPSPRLAPVYDMLSMAVYAPPLANAGDADALVQTAECVLEHLKDYPTDAFESMADRMLELWAIGTEILDAQAARQIRSCRQGLT